MDLFNGFNAGIFKGCFIIVNVAGSCWIFVVTTTIFVLKIFCKENYYCILKIIFVNYISHFSIIVITLFINSYVLM